MRYIKTILTLTALCCLMLLAACSSKSADKMIEYPVSDDPSISFRLWFNVGSQDDPAGKAGLAALTAGILADGATQKHSLEEINDMLYPMAAGIGQQVDKEMTIISGRVHRDNLESYYQILKEVVLEPAFSEDDFNRVKSDYLNYISKSLRYSDDEELGKELLSKFIFTGTNYAHMEEGNMTSVEAISLPDVKSFYQKYYTRDNLRIGLGGGYPPEFAEKVKRDFQALPAGAKAPVPVPAVQPINGMEVQILEKEANATAISFGFPIEPVRGEKDYYALALANSWLGEHRNSSSHLYQVIREVRGLNYGDYSYIEHFPNGGRRQFPPANIARRQQIFQVWIRPVPNEARLFSFRAAVRELQNLVDNGMSQEDFDLTKKFLKNYVLHYAPTTMYQLGYAIDDKFYGLAGSHLEMFRQTLDELTLADVNAAIQRHLQYQNMKVVFVTRDAEALKSALVNNTPSPISYQSEKGAEVLEEDKIIAAYPLSIPAENIEILSIDQVFN